MTLRSVLSTFFGAHRPRARRALAVGLAGVLVLGACAGTGGGEAAGEGTTLTIATSFTIDDLDPLENGFWGPEFGYVELLMRPERDGTPAPWVLTDLATLDERTWRLTLNEGVAFTNGRALDGAALAQLLTWTAQNHAGFAAASAFERAQATGPREVTLTTSTPVPTLANVLADESMVPVFDVDAYEAHRASGDPADALLDAGLYTGPFVMESLDGQTAALTPVPDHWSGGPELDALTLRFVPEATARVQAVQTGEADLALYMPTAVARTLDGRDDAFWVTGPPTGSTFSFMMNTASPGFEDPRVRRAAFAAVDYRALAEDVLGGQVDVATSAFPSSLPGAVHTQSTDPALAADLLEEAGWTAGPGGVRRRDGQPLRLRLLSYPQQPDSTTIATAMQGQLGAVGFAVQVQQVDDITAAREGDDWDGAITGASLLSFGGSPVEGIADTLGTGGDQNYSSISDPALDAVIAELRTTFDADRRTQLLHEVQRINAAQGYWAATVARRPGVVTNETWRGYETPVSNLWVTTATAP